MPACFEPLESRQLLSCDLVGSIYVAAMPNPLVPGDVVPLSVIVTNQGDQRAVGLMDIHYYLSTQPSIDGAVGPLILPNQTVSLAPGKRKTYTLKMAVPSTIPAGSYYLIASIDPARSIAGDNAANNTAVTGQSRPLVYQFGTVPGRSKTTKLKLTDADGSVATFSISGRGLGELTPDGNGGYSLSLTGTTSSSRVSISVTGGDGRYTLGDVTLGSLKSFSGTRVDLAGDFTVTGNISSLTIGDIAAGTSFVQTGVLPLTLKARNVSSLSLQAAGRIKSITVASWTRVGQAASQISTTSIASFTSGGEAAVDLNLSSTGVALGKLTAAGQIGPGQWNVAGSAGQISAAATDPGLDASFKGSISALAIRGNASGNLSAKAFGSIAVNGDLSGAKILAGTYLGNDLALGGEGLAADTYSAGAIGKFSVAGSVSDSWIFAGIHPFDGVLNDINDVTIGGSASYIKSVTIGGTIDAASSFNAARLPATASIAGVKLITRDDSRFAQNSFAMTDAGMTDDEGTITLNIAGQSQTFNLFDEATLAPLAGAGVAVAVDADTRSVGVMTIISPYRRVPVQFVVLKGSAAAAAPQPALSLWENLPLKPDADEPVTILTTDVATKAVQDVFTDKLVSQVFYNVAENQQSAISSMVGGLASAFTSLVTIGVHALDNVSHGAVSDYIASLPIASNQVLTPEQAKQQVIDNRANDLASTMVLATMKGKLDPMAPYGVMFDLGTDYVQWNVADMADDLPNMGVRVTTVLGVDIYSFAPIPPWQQAQANGLVNVQVPTAADAQNGFLELISKSDLGGGYIVPLDTGGNAEIPVPLGDYIGVVHAQGYQPRQVPVNVTADALNLNALNVNVTLDLPPDPGFIIEPDAVLETSERRTKATFTVALATQPTANVTIRLRSSDTTEGKISKTTLTFTPTNWHKPQMVVVTGVNDSLRDGNKAYQVILSPAVSADLTYNGMDPDDVSVINVDNEEPTRPTVTIASATPVKVFDGYWWDDYDITVTGTASGPVGTNFYFNGPPPPGFVMTSWTGMDSRGRPCRAVGDPPSTNYTFIRQEGVQPPTWSYVVTNLYGPGSVPETVQAKYDVYLS